MSEKSKTVSLEVAERIMALGLLRQWKGNLEELTVIQEDIKQLPFSEEEKNELEVRDVKDGDNNSITWKPGAPVKNFSFSKVSVDFIVARVKELSDQKKLSLSDGPVVALYEKLK